MFTTLYRKKGKRGLQGGGQKLRSSRDVMKTYDIHMI